MALAANNLTVDDGLVEQPDSYNERNKRIRKYKMKIALDSNIFILSFYRAGNPEKVFGRITNSLGELYKKYQKVKNIKPEDYLEMIINSVNVTVNSITFQGAEA